MEFYLIRRGVFQNPLKICLDKDEVSIGRLQFQQLQTSDVVSRYHATLKNTNGNWSVVDLRSTNGLFVNGIKKNPFEPVSITAGDRIGLGTAQGISEKYFEFEFCQQEIIILSDSDDKNSVMTIKVEETPITSHSVLAEHPVSYNHSEIINYRSKYAHILNAEQPVVLLHRCDLELKRHNTRKLKHAKKRRRINCLDSSSSSEDSSELSFKKSRIIPQRNKYMFSTSNKNPVKQYHSNVFSSSESSGEDEESSLHVCNRISNIKCETNSIHQPKNFVDEVNKSELVNRFNNKHKKIIKGEVINENITENSSVIESRTTNTNKPETSNIQIDLCQNSHLKCKIETCTTIQNEPSFEKHKQSHVISEEQSINFLDEKSNSSCDKFFKVPNINTNMKNNKITKLFNSEKENSASNEFNSLKQLPCESFMKKVNDKENCLSIKSNYNISPKEIPSINKVYESNTQQLFKNSIDVTHGKKGFNKIFCSESYSGSKNYTSQNNSASVCPERSTPFQIENIYSISDFPTRHHPEDLNNISIKSEELFVRNPTESERKKNEILKFQSLDESSAKSNTHKINSESTSVKVSQSNEMAPIVKNSGIKTEVPDQIEFFIHNAAQAEIKNAANHSITHLASTSSKEISEESPFKLITGIKSENSDPMEDEDIGAGAFCYSQKDECIVISDDESYLNFSSSQENVLNAYNIKVEPPECDDLNFEYHDDMCKNDGVLQEGKQKIEIFEDKISEGCESLQTRTESVAKKVEINSIPDSENIDAIQEFIKQFITVQEPSSSGAEFTNHSNQIQSNESTCEKINLNVNDFFPVLTQDSNTEKETELEKSSSDIEENEDFIPNFEFEEPALGNKNKSGTILLTEAKPMQFRARKHRGREEWFQERCDTNSAKVPSVKLQKKQNEEAKAKHNNEIKAKPKPQSKRSSNKSNLRDKIKKTMGHRIPLPNGGSAVPCGQKNKIVKKAVNNKLIINNKLKEANTLKSPAGEPSNYTKHLTSEYNENSKNYLEKPPARFKSRSEFLSKTSLEIDESVISKNSKSSKFKIPKVKSTVGQNISASTNKKLGKSVCAKTGERKSLANDKTKNSNSTESIRESGIKELQNCSSTNISETVRNKTNGCWLRLSDQRPFTEISKSGKRYNQNNLPHSLSSVPVQENTVIPSMIKKSMPVIQTHDSKINKHSFVGTQKCSVNQLTDPRLREDKKGGLSVKEQYSSVPSKSQGEFDSKERICIVQPHRPSVPKQVAKKPIRLDFDSVLANILYWNPSWLKEYKTVMKTPPPSIIKNVKSLPLSFASVDHYIASFFPFILLELWEYIYKEYSNIRQLGNPNNEINAICIMVTKCISKGDIMLLHCESLIGYDSAFYPREGNIIIIEVYEENNSHITKLFGYISTVDNKRKVNTASLHHQWKKRFNNEAQNLLLYEFSVKMKKTKFQVALEKLTRAYILCYMANKIRLADGLQYLLASELQRYLLQPFIKCIKGSNDNILLQSVIGKYNSNQIAAINGITNEIRTGQYAPKLLLLQGPPGTGKTHTIAGIVQSLLADKNAKILITAPSNAAVDEVGRRLIAIRKEAKNEIKIVRVGVYSQIHKDMLPYTLEDLTKKFSDKSSKQELEKLTTELFKKQKLICDLQQQITVNSKSPSFMNAVHEAKKRLMMENRRMQSLLEEIDRIKTKPVRPHDPSVYSDKLIVLAKANVIITTLGSCRLKILEKVFSGKSGTRFTCCIVDEATQCTEPEILQLLAFDVCKLVLIGDHKQLPATVYSHLSNINKYDVSLFERIHLFLAEKKLPSPIFMLTEQYRMHSEICSFPSYQFYSNKLCTAPCVNQKYSSFPLKPFIVFNINDSQESNIHSSKKNVLEAEVISEICKQLLPRKEFRNYSVGIITPYLGQKDLVLQKFSDKKISGLVTIDTVDRFQGSERDFIILSCVRARSQNGSIGFVECEKRLNVAITRAKQCLIICGHMTSLERDPIWKSLIAYSKQFDCYITVTALEDIPFLINEIKRNKNNLFKK